MKGTPEYELVESPLVEQLKGLGWAHIEGSVTDPVVTERDSFRTVLLHDRFRAALTKLNRGPSGEEWLDDARLSEAASALERLGPATLIEANQQATDLLLEGFSVQGLPDWDQGRNQRIDFINWDKPDDNDFLVVNQFRVDEPGGQAKDWITPDLVLFVNGIPLVVIECKGPDTIDPMAEGIKQLRRYSNQRGVEDPEGNEQLFWTNQILVSTYGEHARLGTITAEPEHYLEWKDSAPLPRAELAASLGKAEEDISSQELLCAGVLKPANLLDIVRHCTLFSDLGGKTAKIVARYQQYRAVQKTLARLKTGKTRAEDGEFDRRGGLVWHTQGSGKSLTMVFLVRAMRSDADLRRFKVVAVTDRTDLEKQLFETATLSGDVLEKATTIDRLKGLLSEKGPGLVFAMIQKYRLESDEPEEDAGGDIGLGVLNDDEEIVVLVDEAHRSQGSVLHANLMAALPNAAKIGFTGTPIMRADKKRTEDIFGPFLDKYTIRQSEADGATVPIIYEGRTAKGAVRGASDLDELFEDMLGEHTTEQLEVLKARYATTGSVLEAPGLIAAKARSMLLHYVGAVMPGGFKAQLAATSRLAAVRYREALVKARADLVDEIAELPEDLLKGIESGETDAEDLDRRQQVLIRAHRHLDLIRVLDFVPVISGTNNDDPAWKKWTSKSDQDAAIASFKKPLGPAGDKTSPVAFLIVKSMLLTGFDAPHEQVLYLDRSLQDAELLQAVARVNRTAKGKTYGLLVDYYGVGAHLQSALARYAPEDVADTIEAVTSIDDELPKLRDRHARVEAIFHQAGIERFDDDDDIEACVQVLQDPKIRARFDVALKQFLATMDLVMPRPEALPFVRDAKTFGLIQFRARRRYRDDDLDGFDPSLYGDKVRELIDEHIDALDIATKIPPVSITDPDFLARVRNLGSDRAKASEMEHALRFHIRKHFDEDPARYAKLSERLDSILDGLRDQWDQLSLALEELLEEAREDGATGGGDDPLIARFRGLLESELAADGDVPEDLGEGLTALSEDAVIDIGHHVHRVNFWHNAHAQDELQKSLVVLLYERGLFTLEEAPGVADRLVDLARSNQALFEARGSDD